MEQVFQDALGITLGHEGAYSDNPYDSGGQTKWGITQATAKVHGYVGVMADMPLDVATDIYLKSYWRRPKLDQIAQYDKHIAIKLFDAAVNMGVKIAGIFIQRAINTLSRNQSLFQYLDIDGIIGSCTIDALEHLPQLIEKQAILKMINAQQAYRYINLCESDPSQQEFIRGWMHRVN